MPQGTVACPETRSHSTAPTFPRKQLAKFPLQNSLLPMTRCLLSLPMTPCSAKENSSNKRISCLARYPSNFDYLPIRHVQS
jgi:hypothetical protein